MPPWKNVKLGDVGYVVTGKTPSSKFPSHFGHEVPFVTPTDFGMYNKYIYNSIRYLSKEGVASLSNKLLPKNSVIVTCIGSDMGKVAMNNIPCITNQQINSIIPDSKSINSDFLYYKLIYSYETLKLLATGGSTMPILNKGDFEKIEIKIPDLPTQFRIASILSAFDDKIELNHQMNNTLEQMAQALYKKYFVAGIDPDNLPEGWRWGKLINEYKIIMGQSPPGSSYNEEKIGIPFFQGRTDFEFRFPSIRVYTTDPKRLAKKFDTLLSVRAPVGDINIANENCCIGRGLAALRSQNGYQSYCFYKLRFLSETFNMYNGEGTVFGSINKDTLGSLATVIPNRKTLEQFKKLVQPLDEHIFTLSNEISILISIRNSLLPKLMNGEIPVDSVSLEESQKAIVA